VAPPQESYSRLTGKTSADLVDATGFPLAYLARGYAYGFLLTDVWPPFED